MNSEDNAMRNRKVNSVGLWFKCLFRISCAKGTNGAGRWARNNTSGIADFSFHYDGTVGGNNYHYRIVKEEESVVFTYESMERRHLGEVKATVDEDVLGQLNELYLRYRVAEWHKYSKYNPYVCDGEGFSLNIGFNDGATLYAGGMNAFPPRYREFYAAMGSILDPVRDALLASVEKE